MKRLLLLLIVILSNLGPNNIFAQHHFIANEGQWDNKVLFKSEFAAGNLFIENGSFNFNLYDADELNELVLHHHKDKAYHDPVDWIVDAHCLKMNFYGSNDFIRTYPGQKLTEYYNYYLGKDPNKWASNVKAYHQLLLENVYDGIDVKLQAANNSFKYDFIVQAGKTPNVIALEYEGAENISLKGGKLYVQTSVTTMIEQEPYSYQIIEGNKITVDCEYALTGDKVSFEFPNGYNSEYELIIDPFIVFSRYSSSFSNNFGYTATFDEFENAYGAGSVFGTGYQTVAGSYDIDFNGGTVDIGITKYTADGLNRIYATFLGGTDTELPHSLVVNSQNELFVFGTTSSLDFPIDTNQTTIDSTYNGGNFANFSNGLGVNYNNGSDLFVARFSEDGDQLMASTYLGGSGNDGLNTSLALKYNYADEVRGEVLIDSEDNCYVVTCTFSNDFPIVGGFQTANAGGSDAVILKMDGFLTNIQWSSYLGGSTDEAAYSLAFDQSENLVIAGGTNSTDFPLQDPLIPAYQGGISDGFITKIHNSGSGVLHSTYYGSNDYDQIYFVETNELDEVYIFGQTNSASGQLVKNAIYQKPNGGQLLAKFTSPVDSIIWSTRFGDESGVPDISPTAFLVDVCNQVFLSGWGATGLGGINTISGTSGLDVTADALDPTTDDRDFYFMVLKNDASQLIYGSFFGGDLSREHVDGGTSRFDKKGVVYQAVCAGCGSLQDFPTVPMDSLPLWQNNNSCNLGIVKYAFTPPTIIADFDLPPVNCVPVNLLFQNQSQAAFGDTSNTDFYWSVNDSVIESYDLQYLFLEPGSYEITLLAIDSQSCNFADSVTKFITIIGNGYSVLDTAITCNGIPVQIGIDPISGFNIEYEWTPTDFLSASNVANPIATVSSDMTYTLIISNGNCQDTLVQPVRAEVFDLDFEIRDSICLGDTVTITALGEPNAFFNWSPESQLESGQGLSEAVFSISESQYVYVTATSNDGCVSEDSLLVTVLDLVPDVIATADPDSIFQGDGAQLIATSIDVSNFMWDADSTLSALNIDNPIATPSVTTTYTVRVSDDFCPNNAQVTVFVKERTCVNGEIFIPNAFSPNNDGANDVFIVRSNVLIDDFEFAVYDRWGNEIFVTNDMNESWDGTIDGKLAGPEVFAWYVKGTCPGGEDLLLKGNVSLLH